MDYICKYVYNDVFIAGFQHYDTSTISDGDEVVLAADPNNQYYHNAVAVLHSGQTIGYLPKNNLQDMYHDYISRGGKVTASVTSAEKMQMCLRYFLPEDVDDQNEDGEPSINHFTFLDEKTVRSLNQAAFEVYSKDFSVWFENLSEADQAEKQAISLLEVIRDERDKRAHTGNHETKKKSHKSGYSIAAFLLMAVFILVAINCMVQGAYTSAIFPLLLASLVFAWYQKRRKKKPSAPKAPMSAEPTSTPVASVNGSIVWVSGIGGKRYHNDPLCSNMEDPTPISLTSAIQQGYTPCKRCC